MRMDIDGLQLLIIDLMQLLIYIYIYNEVYTCYEMLKELLNGYA